MLPRASRIKKSDFPVLIKTSRNLGSENFSLKFSTLSDPQHPSLFSVVVSKKIAKTAVGRNKLKRRIRYVLSKNLAKMEKGFQIAIFLRINLNKTSYFDLERELLTLMTKAKLFYA